MPSFDITITKTDDKPTAATQINFNGLSYLFQTNPSPLIREASILLVPHIDPSTQAARLYRQVLNVLEFPPSPEPTKP
jgi:hypothetical protein